MRRAWAVFMWDLRRGVGNRLLHLFAFATLVGGGALFYFAPEAGAVPSMVVLLVLFFGSLFAVLIGWASGQQSRSQGALLFAQPLGPTDILLGKLVGTGSWCLVLVLLVLAPAAARAGSVSSLLGLGALSSGLLLVFLLAGLVVGLVAEPIAGLLAVLLGWAVAVIGWEIGLAVLAETGWVTDLPGLFVALVLANPSGAFRVSALVGLEAVPLDLAQIEGWGTLLRQIDLVTAAVFAAWGVLFFGIGVRALSRQEL